MKKSDSHYICKNAKNKFIGFYISQPAKYTNIYCYSIN
jgi:hypothetical protein